MFFTFSKLCGLRHFFEMLSKIKMYKLVVFLVLLSYFVNENEAYFITVDAHGEECFFDKVEAGTKMGLTFEIAEGEFLDIDVLITGPKGVIIYQTERESSGKYSFTAYRTGVYTYCFLNKMSAMTPKVVMFNMAIGEAPKAESQDGGSANKLEEMITELSAALTEVKREQEYMLVRDRIHHSINKSTNSRVDMWSFFEALILVAMTCAMTVGQVYYLKRFFEVRRVV